LVLAWAVVVFGEVYRAVTPGGVPCAIKVSLRPMDEANPEVKKELDRLRMIKNLVGHPHIVGLGEIWVVEGDFPTRWELAQGSLDGTLIRQLYLVYSVSKAGPTGHPRRGTFALHEGGGGGN